MGGSRCDQANLTPALTSIFNIVNPLVKTPSYTACSLDGFLATKDNSLNWLLHFGAADGPADQELLAEIGVIAVGSATDQWLLNHVFKAQTSDEESGSSPSPRGFFMSRKLASVRKADLRFVQGAATPVHRQMVAAAMAGT